MQAVNRRSFIAAGSSAIFGASASGSIILPETRIEDAPSNVRAPESRVREFVGACHVRIDRVREMLEEDQGLAKASWDWGYGDWETGIGASSHTGQRDIIELLMSHGARPSVFTMATLDKVDSVKAFVETGPHARTIEGPHSISLYRHARAGKAARVMEYLESIGMDSTENLFQTDSILAAGLVGVYSWSSDPSNRYIIKWVEKISCLSLQTPKETSRNLMPISNTDGTPNQTSFRPAGSNGALITFYTQDKKLRLEYAGTEIIATRM